MEKYKQEEIVNHYTREGVPMSSLKRMCREAKISYPKLCKFLNGQTMGLIGNEPIVYPGDIIRFIKGLPNND